MTDEDARLIWSARKPLWNLKRDADQRRDRHETLRLAQEIDALDRALVEGGQGDFLRKNIQQVRGS